HQDLSPTWYRGSPIFYFAPPQQSGESDSRLHRFLNALTEQPLVLIYISTTGVYGDLRGAMADESMPLNPSTPRARRRASAEEISRVWCHEHSVRRVVLRVPAIYGPGRLPLDRLRSGEPAVIESEAPIINRIHVDDLVSACVAAYRNENARGVYNVSDGNDLTMTAYLKRVAEQAQLPMPSQITLEHAHVTLNSQMLSYLDESRRISNARMRNELGVELRYADVDEGIRSSLVETNVASSSN
ncbi:MAG TPA: NAD-dependent epimerase/dehydratase family protein, partial [Steroidobacteraceae bacterium]|nr:NAD-dependent epimerase/dehydratase family protein [Steroidobacteraceae bacterium]